MRPEGGTPAAAPEPGRAALAPLRRGEVRGSRRSRGGLGLFLLAGALPAAAVAWFLLQPAARRDELLAKVPAGWGGRAIHAGIAFGALIVLARLALPAFHNATGALGGVQQRMAARTGVVRVLLFPVEALVGLLRVVCQALFAVDAVLILAACLVLLLLVARIVKPGLLPDVLPRLGA